MSSQTENVLYEIEREIRENNNNDEELVGEEPFYKQPIKKPKSKKLSNWELLQKVLPFYDDYELIEDRFNMNVNVFAYENKVHPIYLSKKVHKHVITLRIY